MKKRNNASRPQGVGYVQIGCLTTRENGSPVWSWDTGWQQGHRQATLSAGPPLRIVITRTPDQNGRQASGFSDLPNRKHAARDRYNRRALRPLVSGKISDPLDTLQIDRFDWVYWVMVMRVRGS